MKKYFLTHGKLSTSLLCIGFFVAGILFSKVIFTPTIIKATVLRESGYAYINPVLLCNTNNNQKYNEDTALSSELRDYVQSKPENDISVYFLSVANGGWASVNDTETYSPASMLKIPTVVETFKYQETNPDILSQKVYYDGSFDDNKAEYFKPAKSIEPGKYYTVGDLIPYIVNYSDNNALRVLHNTINPDSFIKLYKDLGIEIPTNTLDFMSAKTYSLFLRVLYNSTYLSREMSEKVLKLMTVSDFPHGLRAGVPAEIEVAEKFGERQVFQPNGTLTATELHDCGIVYAPNKPYIICVMTRGKDFQSLASSIQDISAIVYKKVTE